MRAKKTVSPKNAAFEIGFAIGVASVIYQQSGLDLVVTSLNDGKHSSGSLHYSGRAVDLRTRNLGPGTRGIIYKALQRWLEPLGFDVVDESDHFHIEFQPKPGESFIKRVE